MAKIAVKLPGLSLTNPLMPASGSFGFGDVPAANKFDLNRLGALVLKTTTIKPKKGNPQPQIKVEDDKVLNSVGLTNPGVDQVIAHKITAIREKYPFLPIIASIGGASIAEYVDLAKKFAASQQVNALEINVSCPNVDQGGMHFGIEPAMVERLTQAVTEQIKLPVYVKLTPNVTDIVQLAQAAARGGASGLCLINTLLGLDIDIQKRCSVLGNGLGGVSGQAIQPIALRMVYQVHQTCHLPIIGMGGIESASDVVKFFLAGASAVAVGAAHFQDGKVIPHINAELPSLLDKMGVKDINDLIGQVSM